MDNFTDSQCPHINKTEVRDFFNRCAPHWDDSMVINDGIISVILDCAKVGEGKSVLDVACGTGVMIPFYFARNVNSVTGVDISCEMIDIARAKFIPRTAGAQKLSLVCADIDDFFPETMFDCAVVYNAFPHFPEPRRLIEKLESLLNPGGTLTIAHSMSREALARHHSGSAVSVSLPLPPPEEIVSLFPENFTHFKTISDEKMFLVSAEKY